MTTKMRRMLDIENASSYNAGNIVHYINITFTI